MARASPIKRPYKHPRVLDSVEVFDIFSSNCERSDTMISLKTAPVVAA